MVSAAGAAVKLRAGTTYMVRWGTGASLVLTQGTGKDQEAAAAADAIVSETSTTSSRPMP